MRKLRGVIIALLVVALVAGLWWARTHVPFDWTNLRAQLRAADWRLVLLGVLLIHVSITLRAWRWRLLMGRQAAGVASARLIGTQFAGFSAVALFGRVADLTRPYLVARKTGTPVAGQLAVYSMERAFDLASAAVLFSATLVFAPKTMPHHEAFARAGVLSLVATLGLAAFALAVRFSGATLASIARGAFRVVSQGFANGVAEKILDFREGMMTVSSVGQLLGALAWSLVIWVAIASAYMVTARAFVSSPTLATFSVPATMLLLATSMGGSLLQLPVVGWFTQIGVLAVALHGFFGVPVEVASAAGALLLVVTTLCVVPAGLIAAKLEGVSLRAASSQGMQASEDEPR